VIYASLRASGNAIPTNDLWIAASTMEHGTELVTLDRGFRHVPQILVALFES
jgi:tRNA(fMet)-specific endonuclease VapC